MLSNLVIFYSCPALALYPVNGACIDLKFNTRNNSQGGNRALSLCLLLGASVACTSLIVALLALLPQRFIALLTRDWSLVTRDSLDHSR